MDFDFTVVSDGGRSSKARLGRHELRFDMPRAKGGEGKGPGPLAYFVVSSAACFHYYASGVLVDRGLATEGLEVRVRSRMSESGPKRIEHLRLEVCLAEDTPEDVRAAVEAAVRSCPIHNVLCEPPELEVAVERAEDQT